jgi:hypothetical protein
MPTEIKTLETTAPVINRTPKQPQQKAQQQMKRPSTGNGTEASNKKQKS